MLWDGSASDSREVQDKGVGGVSVDVGEVDEQKRGVGEEGACEGDVSEVESRDSGACWTCVVGENEGTSYESGLQRL